MTKDEELALDLALETLESIQAAYPCETVGKRITAIKQARSAPVREPKCNPHPKAPHGFDRNASHNADRYVCECEGWDAYDAGYQAGIEDTYKRMEALDKKAENARELGLDYEPADGTQVSKVWWDGEKLMAKPIPFVEFYKPVQGPSIRFNTAEALDKAKADRDKPVTPVEYIPVISEVGSDSNMVFPDTMYGLLPKGTGKITLHESKPAPVQSAERGEPVGYVAENGVVDWNVCAPPILTDLYTTPPAAQRQWVELTPEKIDELMYRFTGYELLYAIQAELKENNT
jgi:hypothetical protein